MRITFVKQSLLTVIMLICFFSTSLWANIVVFMDNSGSIKKYKPLFDKQINEIYKMAEEVNKTVVFIPIGNKRFVYANSYKKAKQIFSFDNSYTCVAEAFQNAEKNGLISFDKTDKQTVIIISDMEPDITNTKNDWELLSIDYKNILQWYQKLVQWIKKGVSIHILQLNASSVAPYHPDEVAPQKIISDLKLLIKGAKDLENLYNKYKKPTNSYFQDQASNKKLVDRVTKALQSALIDSGKNNSTKRNVSIIPTSLKEDILAILQGIIDPSIIVKFQVKIEIDPNLVNLERPEQVYALSYILNNAPVKICNNPNRDADYTIINGPCDNAHDDRYHYHFKFKSGLAYNYIDIELSHKYTNKKGSTEIMADENRFSYNVYCLNINDLIMKILNELNKLYKYQAEDFPLGEKEIIITLQTDLLHLFIGERLKAKTRKISDLFRDKKSPIDQRLSRTHISKDGQCSMSVKRQADSDIYLSRVLYKDDVDKEIDILLGTVTASQIRGVNNNIVLKDLPTNLAKNISIQREPNAANARIQVIPYDFHNYDKPITELKSNEKKDIFLLQGSYRYNVLFDNEKENCVDIWLTKLHVEDDTEIPAFCVADVFKDKKNIKQYFSELIQDAKKNLHKNELNSTFKDQMTSPYYFLRLFEYTNENGNNPLESSNIKDIWRRIYLRLYKDKIYGNTLISKILKPALEKLQLYEDNKLMNNAHLYLQCMLAQYSQQPFNSQFNQQDKQTYNIEILQRIFKNGFHFNDFFIQALHIN